MSIFRKLFGQYDSDGETPEFKALIEGSMEGLRIQTEACRALDATPRPTCHGPHATMADNSGAC